MAKTMVVLLFCATTTSAWAETCPSPMADDLNLTAYAGTWYPVMAWWATNCSSVDYAEVNGTTLSVRNSSLGVVSGEYETVEGVAVLGEGKRFSVSMVDNYTDDYYVVATDYSNYSLVMSCDSSHNTTPRAVVLGRGRNLTDEVRQVVAEKLTLGDTTPVGQSDCPNAAPAASLPPPLGLLFAALAARRCL